jgi:hypothetical protein
LLSTCNLAAGPLVAVAAGIYLITDIASVQHASILWFPSKTKYLRFIFLEFGVLCLLLPYKLRDGIEPYNFATAIVVLLVLPFFRFGVAGHDLTMRGSIPALAVIMFAVVDGWARPLRILRPNILVTVVLLIGTVTPASEIARALLWPRWEPRLDRSVYDATGGNAPSYMAKLTPDSLIGHLLRQPTIAITP